MHKTRGNYEMTSNLLPSAICAKEKTKEKTYIFMYVVCYIYVVYFFIYTQLCNYYFLKKADVEGKKQIVRNDLVLLLLYFNTNIKNTRWKEVSLDEIRDNRSSKLQVIV